MLQGHRRFERNSMRNVLVPNVRDPRGNDHVQLLQSKVAAHLLETRGTLMASMRNKRRSCKDSFTGTRKVETWIREDRSTSLACRATRAFHCISLTRLGGANVTASLAS